MAERASAPSFGQLLRRLRVGAGYTQEQLAERAGLSARTVSDLERAVIATPRPDSLDMLITALALTAEDRAALEAAMRRSRAQLRSGDTAAAEADTTGATLSPTSPPPPLADTLPAQPTALIGREDEIAAVCARLLDPETRLLTLTGPGGVGKTRVALEVVARCAGAASAFLDGVRVVSLAALSDPALVLDSIAQCVEVRETPDQPLAETLSAALREKKMLLVLDNFEHILPAAQHIQALLMATTHLKALATSRAALHVRGERLYVVPPLAVPAPPLPPLDALSQYEAVRLFIARAHDVAPGFAVTNQTAPAVAEICARLDGLPLAIELVAARVRLLGPEELLARLDRRLKVAGGGPRDLPARQQTLRAAIDWSYNLLDPAEQTFFARLAVFQGGRTLEAIEAICNAAGDLPVDVLDGVESLLDKSLLRRDVAADGAPRLVMLETIHEFARERLEAGGEKEALQRAHAAYYLALAERAERELRGPRQTQWLARLEAEHDNLRAALAWSLAPDGDAELGLRLAAALGQFWDIRGHWSEGRRHLAAALAQAGGAAPTARAHALLRAGRLAVAQRDWSAGSALLVEARTQARALDDGGTEAEALVYMGGAAYLRGDLERAVGLLEESLAMARAAGARWVMGYAINLLAWYAEDQGNLDLAEARYEESAALFRALGDTRGLSAIVGNFGMLALLRGEYTKATTLMREAIELARAMGFRQGEIISSANLGLVALKQGNAREALDHLTRGLVAARPLHEVGICVGICEGIAEAAQHLGHVLPAVRLLGAADELRRRMEVQRDAVLQDDYERLVAALRAALSPADFEAAWAAGAALSLDEAMEEALALASQ